MKQTESLTESVTDTPCPYLSQLKPFSGQETFQEYLINHYALMAMNEGSIGHARWMVRKWEKEIPQLAGLGILTAEKIKELKNDTFNPRNN